MDNIKSIRTDVNQLVGSLFLYYVRIFIWHRHNDSVTVQSIAGKSGLNGWARVASRHGQQQEQPAGGYSSHSVPHFHFIIAHGSALLSWTGSLPGTLVAKRIGGCERARRPRREEWPERHPTPRDTIPRLDQAAPEGAKKVTSMRASVQRFTVIQPCVPPRLCAPMGATEGLRND